MMTGDDNHDPTVDIGIDELMSCPFCGEFPTEFEDGEIQCSNKKCSARPSVKWAGRGAWNTRYLDQ